MPGISETLLTLDDSHIVFTYHERFDDELAYLQFNGLACGHTLCDDLSVNDINFGMCDMVLGYGVVEGQCQTISGCALPPGIELFGTMQACNASCR